MHNEVPSGASQGHHRRAVAVGILMACTAMLVVAAVTAMAGTQPGTAGLDKRHYELSSTAVLTVTDADLNTSATERQSATVNLKSTSDGNGIQIVLQETANDSGVFSGTVGFNLVASDGVARSLKVAAGDAVTLTYTDASPSATVTDTARMFTDDATGSFDKARYSVADTATLAVTDVDRNLDATTAETISVNLKSESDGTGVDVVLTETAADSGLFSGTARFTTGSSSGTTLKVAAGNTLTLTYSEPLFAGTTATRTATAVMNRDGTTAFTATVYSLMDAATARVTDTDLNTSAATRETVAVNVKSTSDTSGISVTLTETGLDTGVFEGTTRFTSGPSTANELKTASGDTLTVTYAEVTTFSGTPATRTATARMATDGTA
ncbi:MAG: hypothetical protein KY454_06030, partial [Actinobacteria bacterium]|nr:hypothetical protein [Actinomycetota bacterium]